MTAKTLSKKVEFGDFQTPPALAAAVCRQLYQSGVRPAAVLEPTCGVGGFLVAAADRFGPGAALRGYEIDPAHARRAAAAAARCGNASSVAAADFFETDWGAVVAGLPEPFLILGNPPWVTNSALAAGGGRNVPQKFNADRLRGIEAITGRANFDICESVLRRLLGAAHRRRGTLAMLCKSAVARKALAFAWAHDLQIGEAALHRLDAVRHFGASVDAVLLTVRFGAGPGRAEAAVYENIGDSIPERRIGWADGRLVADAAAYERCAGVRGGDVPWRSGVKHDAARVMELTPDGGTGDSYRNGFGDRVELEPEHLFPMCKSSDVAAGRGPSRFMLVPQRHTGEDTAAVARRAPKTWAYLNRHADRLAARRSSIYRGRPPFSVFGVGDYTFTPWKVAVSGFYKSPRFRVAGPADGKPVVFDDTVYFLPFEAEAEARGAAEALQSPAARDYFAAHLFPDAKRPLTAGLLRGLDLRRLGVRGLPAPPGRGQRRLWGE